MRDPDGSSAQSSLEQPSRPRARRAARRRPVQDAIRERQEPDVDLVAGAEKRSEPAMNVIASFFE